MLLKESLFKALVGKEIFSFKKSFLSTFFFTAVLASDLSIAQNGDLLISTNSSETSRVVDDVNITLTSRSGDTFNARTESGKVVLNDIPEGLYQLTAEKSGFRTVIEPSIRIVEDKLLPIEISLVPFSQSASSEEIEELLVVGRALTRDPNKAISTPRITKTAIFHFEHLFLISKSLIYFVTDLSRITNSGSREFMSPSSTANIGES